MKIVTLSDFIGFLSDKRACDFKGDSVDKYLASHELDENSLLPYIFFREETYGRNLIYKNAHFEMLVLTWLPQQRTPIHDHMGQRCWMWLQTGTLTFKNFKTPERDDSPLCVCGPCETHKAGEAAYIDDGIGVHSIANASTRPAVSLHLYAGPIPHCRIYDECAKRFTSVELEYFTTPERRPTSTPCPKLTFA